MKTLLKQGTGFTVLSAIGWIIDLSGFLILTNLLGVSIGIANFMSAIPSITFVFFTSIRKVFVGKKYSLPLSLKYFIYIIYQVALLSAVSFAGQRMFDWFSVSSFVSYGFVAQNINLIIKLIVTCFTFISNFFAMKLIIEKL